MSVSANSADEQSNFGPGGRARVVERLRACLEELAEPGGVVVVVSVGLDRLAQINDTWGYGTGDRLLAEVGRRLSAVPGTGGTAYSGGGDQFLLVFEVDEGEDVEAEVAESVIEAISGPYVIDDHTVYVTASIGIAGTQDAVEDVDGLLSAAETARAEARRSGGRRWVRADQLLHIRVREQVRTAQALHSAIENRELSVYYQPVIDLASGATMTLEALARWNSPQLGVIPPHHFIPRAEETGLIVPIGRWILDEVARQWSGWETQQSVAPGIAVNVSGIQLRIDLDALVERLLATANALPGQLSIEITESILLEDPEGARETLEHLKSLGLRLVIDDFGTGYSSLSQLRQLPVDAIKIDRIFIGRIHESPRDRAIVQAMIQLAHALGIFAIAEGVESQAQLSALGEMACDQVQGFLFSPAVPFAQIDAALREEHASGGPRPYARDRPSYRRPPRGPQGIG